MCMHIVLMIYTPIPIVDIVYTGKYHTNLAVWGGRAQMQPDEMREKSERRSAMANHQCHSVAVAVSDWG